MTGHDVGAALRALPAVDTLLGAAPALAAQYGRRACVAALRAELDAARAAIRAGAAPAADAKTLAARAGERLTVADAPNLKPVFNLTGTVLHTNLGRAPLANAARDAVAAVAGAANVEYDLERGARGQRDALVEPLICELTGAEAAIVVNNNAAAVLLVLNALAEEREVIVSRGELVEIGDAFRIPDIMARARATLHEVGTTNRTHARDYEQAIGEATALLMRVYPSNYAIEGFSGAVADADIAAIAHAHERPFAVDLGSGSLVELADYDLPHEPTVRETLAAGADVVTFSGDKLLGGPQAGLIVGSRAMIEAIRRNPLKRALRCDKLILAALEATLRLYRHPERLVERLPTLALLTRDRAAIEAACERLLPGVRSALAATGAQVSLVACDSQIGSGSLPVDRLPSAALAIAPPAGEAHPGRFLQALAHALAALPVPVIGRTRANALQLDLRCLEDEPGLIESLSALDWRASVV